MGWERDFSIFVDGVLGWLVGGGLGGLKRNPIRKKPFGAISNGFVFRLPLGWVKCANGVRSEAAHPTAVDGGLGSLKRNPIRKKPFGAISKSNGFQAVFGL